jgi:outer membrane protein assembly factor BamE (lipoprotein component of BamABCDE complex)
MKSLLCSLCVLLFTSCVGSPFHETATYNSIHSQVKRNNTAILNLRAGMDKTEVQKSLGKPARSEGYPWGSVWLYRTLMSAGAYAVPDSDFTPLVFDSDKKLAGWGRNYFIERRARYQVENNTAPRP